MEILIMPKTNLTVYGSDWCYDCRRTKRFLTNHAIPFEWFDIEIDQQAEEYVLTVNQGMRSIPTLVFEDGSHLVEPSNIELSKKLGIAS
jgi:glutaredoxin-like protein